MSATQTRNCQKCGRNLPADAKFCVDCGAGTSEVYSSGRTMGGISERAPAPDLLYTLLQEETLGDYDLYAELGRGGMAAVYLALDLGLNRKVAIKTMLPELVSREGMVERFKREAQTAAALSHPHIVQIYSVRETGRLVYFVMKYIEGRSLESVMTERGPLDLDLTRAIVAQVGGALAFANRSGVIHRDVKPANIMLGNDGWAIMTDFGIAKVQEAQNLTATGTAIGTPHYMSPEQFDNKAVTGAADQYSLGVVAFEMLTGRKPFDGNSYAGIITQHLLDPPPDVRALRADIPTPVAETIGRMLAKKADDRFPDIDAAVAAFGAPTDAQGELARTQMRSIAKSGPEPRARMSIPVSPVPTSKVAHGGGALTATGQPALDDSRGARARGAGVPPPTAPTEAIPRPGDGAPSRRLTWGVSIAVGAALVLGLLTYALKLPPFSRSGAVVAPTAGATTGSGRALPTDSLELVRDDVTIGKTDLERGDYATADSLASSGQARLNRLTGAFDTSATTDMIQSLRRSTDSLKTKSASACAAEASVARQRGETPPRCG